MALMLVGNWQLAMGKKKVTQSTKFKAPNPKPQEKK